MDETQTKPNRVGTSSQAAGPRWLSWAVLLILVGLALALRWRYIQEISLAVDEFNTIFAARHVLVRSIPSFPSGNIYPHGFVFTYLTVPFVLGEFNETLARLPGLLVSLATLPLAFWVGRKLFDDRVGLVCAAALALDPNAIVWGGRARMYGLLQLLVILVVYVYYRGLAGDETRPATAARARYLAMGLVVVAIFTHLEAALLLPALGIATLVALPWRRILRRDVILPFVLAGIGAGVFLLMSKLGQPGHLETLQESRPYLDLTADVLSGPQVFAPVFVAPHRLLFSLLALGGLYFLFRPRFERGAPLTYLYAVLGALLVPLMIMAGATWRNERYLFLLLPILYYIAGAVLCRLLDLVAARPGADLVRRTRPWQPAILTLLVALYVGLTGSAQAYQQETGYDLAFRALLDEWQPEAGDVVVTVAPSACAVYLGEGCDHFAIQRGYEEFVVARPGDGVIADLWSATPLMTETEAFEQVLATAPRVWFVTDGWRFQTRYEPDFVQTVLDHMETVYDERGVQIYRAEGYTALPPPEFERERRADFGRTPSSDGALALTGFGLMPSPDGALDVTLYWQALEEAGVGYNASLHLLAPATTGGDVGVAGVDGPVLDGRFQPDLWPQDNAFADHHRLSIPPDLPAGRYRLDLGLYPIGQSGGLLPVTLPPDGAPPTVGAGDRLPLAAITIGDGPALSPMATPAYLDFGHMVRLLGYDLERTPDRSLHVTLYWQALAPVDRDYTVFAQLLTAGGEIADQDDGPPGDPYFPTTTWLPGDVFLDSRTLNPPPGAGDYTLLIGLYHVPSSERLAVTDAHGEAQGDAFRLGPISFGAAP